MLLGAMLKDKSVQGILFAFGFQYSLSLNNTFEFVCYKKNVLFAKPIKGKYSPHH